MAERYEELMGAATRACDLHDKHYGALVGYFTDRESCSLVELLDAQKATDEAHQNLRQVIKEAAVD